MKTMAVMQGFKYIFILNTTSENEWFRLSIIILVSPRVLNQNPQRLSLKISSRKSRFIIIILFILIVREIRRRNCVSNEATLRCQFATFFFSPDYAFWKNKAISHTRDKILFDGSTCLFSDKTRTISELYIKEIFILLKASSRYINGL